MGWRWIALAIAVSSAACGAEPKQPFLANAPHPDNAAVAGVAAGAAAALTIVDPNASTRGKPEKPENTQDKNPVDVKESVPKDVFDRLDDKHAGAGAGSGSAATAAKPAAAPKRKGPPPKIPSPSEAAETAAGSGS